MPSLTDKDLGLGEVRAHPALQVRGLRKVYGGTIALGGVDLEIRRGEIHALLGENGAGKTTLVKIVAGVESSDGGTIAVNGKQIETGYGPREIAQEGVAFLHQQTGLIGDLTVAENIAMVAGFGLKRKLIDHAQVRETAKSALNMMGVEIDPDEMVSNLPVSARAIVAIARSLAVNANVLFLDEPTASLNFGEVETLFTILRRLRSEGVSIILISHRLDEVRAICDRVTVLRDGVVVAVGRMSELNDKEIIGMIVGHEIEIIKKKNLTNSITVMRMSGVSGQRIQDLNLTIASGQILGIAGLHGSGHTEIGSILFGQMQINSGEIIFNGEPYAPKNANGAISRGVSYLPADRNGEGSAPDLSLRENLYLNPVLNFFSFLRNKKEIVQATATLIKFDVRPPEPERIFSTLSGGNAQKVVLSRWMEKNPLLIVLNDPTAAVDIGSRHEIYKRLREAADLGVAVVVITSDMEEVEQVCDRAIVIRAGRVAVDLPADKISVLELIRNAYEAA